MKNLDTPTGPRLLAISQVSIAVLGYTLQRYMLPAVGEVIIGRGEGCGVTLLDPSVSRRHAAITASSGGFTIRDLGSTHGTQVRGAAIGSIPVSLAIDETVRIGGLTVVLQRGPSDRCARGSQPPPSAPMEKLRATLERVAAGRISVLILGETGVGKELLSEAVHARSPRAGQPFLRLNCAALSETLLESELFGHEKGAFTGADRAKPGLLETANGGTVFLDEVGELPMATQVKLLRVIEQREVMRVGGLAPRPIDVRFVSATHRDLPHEIAAGRFRQDLYFRLNGITLTIPPLRERIAELEAFAHQFIDRSADALGVSTPRLTAHALEMLRTYRWPGNIRELRNVIERAVLLAADGAIDREHIVLDVTPPTGKPAYEAAAEPTPPPPPTGMLGDLRQKLAVEERTRIVDALSRAAGNQKVAAEQLGISRRTLLNKLDQYEIARPRKGTGR